MFPTLFQIGILKINTYYVLWAVALITFLLFTKLRAVRLFGMDGDDVASVMMWIYCFGILGSLLGNIIGKISIHSYAHVLKGGMASAPGMLCGGLAGIYRLRRLNMSVEKFSEAATVPAAAMFAIGRMGCFFNGCCFGKISTESCGGIFLVHFPFDAIGVMRYPVQVLESLIMSMLIIAFLIIESLLGEDKIREGRGTFIFPIYIIVYGASRLYFDTLRADIMFSTVYWVGAVVFGCAWLCWGLCKGTYGRRSV